MGGSGSMAMLTSPLPTDLRGARANPSVALGAQWCAENTDRILITRTAYLSRISPSIFHCVCGHRKCKAWWNSRLYVCTYVCTYSILFWYYLFSCRRHLRNLAADLIESTCGPYKRAHTAACNFQKELLLAIFTQLLHLEVTGDTDGQVQQIIRSLTRKYL